MIAPLERVAVADAFNLPVADGSVDLVFGSPPYENARTYGIGADRSRDEWVAWMGYITTQAVRVCKGPVLWVVAGVGNYSTMCERLMIRCEDAGLHCFRPCIWTKNAPPTGSGWYSNDWEYVLAFSRTKKLPHFDVSEIATPLKHSGGGAFRQRGRDGKRKQGSAYPTHTMRKRMPNVVHATVGGGHMGHPLATENEAPFPESLATYFVRSLCPPGGVVLDPFGGSGTTASVARQHGRGFISLDIRPS